MKDKNNNIEENDLRIIRCRMLGHEVTFAYCRGGGARPAGEQLPCQKIFDCWFEQFAVEDYMNRHYTPEQIAQITRPSQPKLASIIEMAQKAIADNRQKGENSDAS
ncbi:MAG: hypothetical protein JW709_06180 [Sedimentisphaerales bacterium]|nr:hypothetical protein [Sedimentisphaerales bacterium]